MKKPLVGHSAPSRVCSNALVLARKLYASFEIGRLTAVPGALLTADAVAKRQLSPTSAGPRPKKQERIVNAAKSAAALCRGAHLVGKGQRLVGAIEKFNGHKDHFLVAKIFKVMDLELTRSVSLMAGLARLVSIFDGAAIMDMLTTAPAGHRCPEIIEHVAVKPDPLARR